MIRTIKTTLASLLMLVTGIQMSMAQGLSAGDMAFAFGGGVEPGAVQEVQRSTPAPQMLSMEEMEATEGEALPLFALGALHAGRWVTTRYVSRTIAANAARSGCNVMCFGTSQQARSLATQAYGRGNVLRHGPSGHARSPVHYSHYQSLSGSPRGHIFYGSRW